MSRNRPPGSEHRGGREIVIRETDDYLEQRPPSEEEGEPTAPWVRNLFQPGVIGVMVACIAWSVLQFVRIFDTNWSSSLLLLNPVLMALIGCATQRTVQRRLLSSSDSLRFRVIELVIMLVLTKLFGYLNETPAQIWADIQTWIQTPAAFFDTETVIAYGLGVLAWWSAGATTRDLDAVSDPARYIGETGPIPRLTRRFFVGGFMLLLFTGLAKVSVSALIDLNHSRVPGLIYNVLLYFLLGLVMLGQLRYARLSGLWHREKVQIAGTLRSVWLRYTLLTLGFATLIALLLPTGYAIPLLDLIAFVIYLLMYFAGLIYFLLTWPIGFLLSLLMGNPELAPAPPAQSPPIQPPPPEPTGPGPPWLMILRSIIFWTLVLGGLIYLVHSYLRDRPDMLRKTREALRHIAPLRWIVQVGQALHRWWLGLRARVETDLPRLIRRLSRRTAEGDSGPRARSQGGALRDRIFYHYFTTLDQAEEEGVTRRRSQTPHEYKRTLIRELPTESDALESLTETFIVARYSAHPLSEALADEAEDRAREIHRALRQRAKDREHHDEDTP